MRIPVLAISLVVLVCSTAVAWNNKGHMVVARLAYLKLSEEDRAAVNQILKKHPHYEEFLSDDKPTNVSEQEWVFWRAATWPDWIKIRYPKLSHPKWHYVDFPFIPPSSSESAEDHQPESENALNALPNCIEKAKNGSDQEKAMNLCWVLHLVGDLQQPLHCTSLFSAEFSEGDRGGNAARYRIDDRIIKLHSFWDGLLGNSTSANSIRSGAQDSLDVASEHDAQVRHDLQQSTSFEEWAKEGFQYAVKYAYLNGDPVPANEEDDPAKEDIPQVPESYATNAGMIARLGMVKGGERLANQIHEILHH
jgi:hypothetical protein